MIIPISFARSLAELASRNILTLRKVSIRFQFGGGADDTLGIADAAWTLTLNGRTVGQGRTGTDGEVSFFISSSETPTLRIFDTDYEVNLHAGLEAITELEGQQKRLDSLGYLTGYQLNPAGNDEPDDGNDGVNTRQATLNLQTDTNLTMDSVIGSRTRHKITDTYGA